MKKTIYFLIIMLGLSFSSCEDFLDKAPDQDLDIEQTFANYRYALLFRNGVYYNLPWELVFTNDWGHNPFVLAADEMDDSHPQGVFAYLMNQGAWSADNVPQDIWNFAYQGIRKANIFLEHIDKIPMTDENERERWRGEMHFLRAFFHFGLLRIYGPLNYVDKSYAMDADFTELMKRIPLDEYIEHIFNDLAKAENLLPLKLNVQEMGRLAGIPTQASCMALKMRILLYRASPLWNGNEDYADFKNAEGRNLFPVYDASRWKIAADYGKQAITAIEAAGYKLYRAASDDPMENYRDIFMDDFNDEVLFAKNFHNWDWPELCSNPTGMGGWGACSPTQELIDAYEMEDGSTPITGYNADGSPVINPESEYRETGMYNQAHPKGYHLNGIFYMYAGREPRFYATINYNNAYWKTRRLNFLKAATDGFKGGPDYTTTGYMMRKFLDEKGVDILQGRYTNKTWIYYRLGELYLNYAEALNESDGPVADVYTYVNAIRNRSGLPDLKSGLDKQQMREKIRHERQIELAFETHRYFDCHRWKIAHITDNREIHGMDINATAAAAFYKRILVEKRVFQTPKHYLWPIHQSEINKAPTLYIQNPGWLTGGE
jgi:hypothetical protein